MNGRSSAKSTRVRRIGNGKGVPTLNIMGWDDVINSEHVFGTNGYLQIRCLVRVGLPPWLVVCRRSVSPTSYLSLRYR